ncbi:2-succinyl-5-enolpyruvyl-6-hydroxy-3-cyclohexene-1-carboxylic-acid synthase [Halobacteriales archaeon QS_9_70_65]|nr:MAG: 2-succinyl-5-enolpyruvyl-6-hydroxy-3-cyclohexene-1-carboxylic-acid synthase [Halobacteriales archaeon QS_9_70_65]
MGRGPAEVPAGPRRAGVMHVNSLWGELVADELAKAGVEAAVLAPGSRSTPLTVALAERDDVETFSHLDERSAAFFALGRAKRTGRPTPLVCTSGTAAANFHPAVVEADAARVPMVLLTADRPPELRDSGANQTVDQEKLYGDAVRSYRTLPEPEPAARKLRSLRTAVSRAIGTATGAHSGPVHLNVPLRKPLEPNADPEAAPAGVPAVTVSEAFLEANPLAATGREGPFVEVTRGRSRLARGDRERLVEAIEAADGGLVVCGPTDRPAPAGDSLADLAAATGFPVLADPLSGHRFGPLAEAGPVCGGYDAYLPALETTPDVVVRFGASPTSKPLRRYLRDAGARQFLVDPAGGWREATFAATDLVVADETRLAAALAGAVDRERGAFGRRLLEAEAAYWELVDGEEPEEGAVLADVIALAPDPATVVVSNSMPVRDLDRFGRPRAANLAVLGNRGASGIDGVTSTALGAGSAVAEPLVAVVGDLAQYHDTEWFRTPHGLDFEPAAELHGLAFARTDDRERLRELFAESVGSEGAQVIEFIADSGRNHDDRRALAERVVDSV